MSALFWLLLLVLILVGVIAPLVSIYFVLRNRVSGLPLLAILMGVLLALLVVLIVIAAILVISLADTGL